jgi:hypothetical protein
MVYGMKKALHHNHLSLCGICLSSKGRVNLSNPKNYKVQVRVSLEAKENNFTSQIISIQEIAEPQPVYKVKLSPLLFCR